MILNGLTWVILSLFIQLGNDQFQDLFSRVARVFQTDSPKSPYISVIAINDSFEEEYGKEWYRRISVPLRAAGAKIVAFDYIFTGDSDTMIPGTQVYLPLYLKQVQGWKAGKFPFPNQHPRVVKMISPPGKNRFYSSVPQIMQEAGGSGHVNLNTTGDGGRHTIYSYLQYGSNLVPSFALATVCGFLGVEPAGLKIHGGQYIEVRDAHFPGGVIKDIRIPIDREGRIIINWYGPWKESFYFIDPRWLMEPENPQNRKKLGIAAAGAIVLIIDNTTRGKDITATPFSSVAPAGITLAHMIRSILEEDFIKPLPPAGEVILYILLIFILILTSQKGIRWKLLRWGLVLLLPLWNLFAFLALKTLFPPLVPGLCLLFSLGTLSVYELFKDSKTTALGIMKKLETDLSEKIVQLFDFRCQEYNITPRQKEIIFLTHQGLETKEIAYKLNLSSKTVSNHLNNIYQKTGSHNKLELVRMFFSM